MCLYIYICFVRRDHARTKLSLMPSVLQKKPVQTATSTTGDKVALNNDDFRKMLLGSK